MRPEPQVRRVQLDQLDQQDLMETLAQRDLPDPLAAPVQLDFRASEEFKVLQVRTLLYLSGRHKGFNLQTTTLMNICCTKLSIVSFKWTEGVAMLIMMVSASDYTNVIRNIESHVQPINDETM